MRQAGVSGRSLTTRWLPWLALIVRRPTARPPAARHPVAILAGIGALAVLAACSGTASNSTKLTPPSRPPVITTRTLPGLGTILVNDQGHALYMFVPDKHSKVTCMNGCLVAWPPVVVRAGSAARAGANVRPALLGSDPAPGAGSGSGRVVTYAGWPLYTYEGDTRPGEATGQGLDMNGGLWYVMRPSGAIVR